MSIGDIFQNVRKERKVNEWILPRLLEHIGSERTVPPPGPNDWLSASKVPTMCHRVLVIATRLGLSMVDNWDAQGRWSADRGTALHIVIQEMWLGPKKWLKGGWKCFECARIHTADMDPKVTPDNAIVRPDACIECGFKPNTFDRFGFVEPVIEDPIVKVRGRTDGIVELLPLPDEILDIKSTGRFEWSPRRGDPRKGWSLHDAPKEDHVKQLHWYMGPSGIRSGRLLYVNPGERKLDRAIIEHRIEFDSKLYETEREKIVVLREALQDETRPVPPCPYDGKNPWGDCACVEVEDLWRRHGR